MDLTFFTIVPCVMVPESVLPSLLTLKGPNSLMAPYPSEEHPGPIYDNSKHFVKKRPHLTNTAMPR